MEATQGEYNADTTSRKSEKINTDTVPEEEILNIRFQLPHDREPEDRLYAYRKIEKELQEFIPGIHLTDTGRMCDHCHDSINRMQKGLDFKCESCRASFDLCLSCQKVVKTTICPKGWGCGYSLSNESENKGWRQFTHISDHAHSQM